MELVNQPEEHVEIRQPTDHRSTILSDSSTTGLLGRSHSDSPPSISSGQHLFKKRGIIFLASIISLSIVSGIVVLVFWYAQTTCDLADLSDTKDDGLKTELDSSLIISGNFKECDDKKKLRIFTSTSKHWKKLVKMLGLNSSHIPPYITLSPLILIPPNSCAVSLVQSTVNHLFIIPKQLNFAIQTPKASGSEIRFLNVTFLAHSDAMRVASVSKQSSFGSIRVSFHRCILYTRVGDTSKHRGKSAVDMQQIAHHRFDRCSLEYYNATVDCDWWKLTTNEEGDDQIGEFELVSRFACLQTGVKSNPTRNLRFLRFSADPARKENISNAYLLSSRFTTDYSTKFTFSLHYALICDNLELTAYVVASNSNYFSAASTSIPFLNLTDPKTFWRQERKTVTIPQAYNYFHILLKASVRNRVPCGRTKYCFKNQAENEHRPTIAIDEISLEIKYPTCSITTSKQTYANFMNTNFDGFKYNNWTNRGWNIRNLSYLQNKTEHRHDDALTKSFEGSPNNCVLLLSFDYLEYFGNTYFRSRLLLANNNCSCTMRFQYTIINSHELVPLHILQKFGVDDASQEENQKTLWYQVKPIKNKGQWQHVEVDIKLVDNRVPFLIEFNDLIAGTSGVWIFIDNISFHDCDFSYYHATR